MMEGILTFWAEKAPTLLGSLLAVLFMAGLAALLGLRRTARIDEAELARLAGAEQVRIDTAVIAGDGKSAVARLDGGRFLVARVMGADISARVVPAGMARVRRRDGRLIVAFADPGFPPLNMKLQEPPSWLAELVEAR